MLITIVVSCATGSDWAVTISFYVSGDCNWFKLGLTFQLVGGIFCGLLLALILYEDNDVDVADKMSMHILKSLRQPGIL